VAMVALLAGPAYAQNVDNHVQRYGEADPEKKPAEIEAEKAQQRAYDKSLGNIPDKGPTDPWGGARGSDAPKPATKTSSAKPRSKPVATPN
jgi:hypothetical protein